MISLTHLRKVVALLWKYLVMRFLTLRQGCQARPFPVGKGFIFREGNLKQRRVKYEERSSVLMESIGPRDHPKAKKKWKRHASIDSCVRALTLIKVASPKGYPAGFD